MVELTIRTDGAEAAGSLRAALERAGGVELRLESDEVAEVGVVAGDAAGLATTLSQWLQGQPPGSGMTLQTSTQVLRLHAGDPRAAIALTEAVTRADESGQQS